MELVKSAAQGVFDDDKTRTKGVYKVGNPYQIEGKWYYPKVENNYSEVGVASWYGSKFHNKLTANGEVFDKNTISAAHRTLPLPSVVTVVNLENGNELSIRVNDRGPFAKDRIIDLSERAAQILGFKNKGTQKVRVVFDRAATEKLRLVKNAKQKSAVGQYSHRTLDNNSYTGAYYVQIGAYGMQKSAENIRKRISKIPAVFIEDVERQGKMIYRVKIGPVKDNLSANKLLTIVRKKGFSDAIIVKD